MLATKSNSYTFQKNGVWYFSRRVPADLRRHYRTGRIAYSLRTKSIRDARVRAMPNASFHRALHHLIEKDFIKKNDNSFECIIKEVHHKEKVDSPSGTAIELKELIENNDHSNIISSIIIESRRVEDINGIHEVRFFNDKDSITFKHEALSRNIFSDGALFIANSITKRSPNLYSVKDFFS